MTDRRIVVLYNYVCPTCDLEIGPYDYDHKTIECGNGCGDLLRPVPRYAYLTTDEREDMGPKVIRKGHWKVKKG